MWRYEHRPGHGVRLFWGEHLYFEQHLAGDGEAPCAHPVSVVGGPDLTCYAPHDHPWHLGFWFGWKHINDINYWEHTPAGLPEGLTRFVAPERLEAGSDSVSLTATYALVDPRRGDVAQDVRTITWYPPAEDGSHRLDYALELVAGPEPVVLDRTPITPETPWGGYGGLSWRFSRGLGDFRGLDAEGRRDRDIEHQRAAWATLYGRLDGGLDIRAGVAIFDHPANPRHPTPWRFIAEPGFGYLNPALLLAEPLTVPGGARMRLRYRVLVYAGKVDPGRLAGEWAEFAATTAAR